MKPRKKKISQAEQILKKHLIAKLEAGKDSEEDRVDAILEAMEDYAGMRNPLIKHLLFIIHGDDKTMGMNSCLDTYYVGTFAKEIKKAYALLKELKIVI